MKKTILLVGGSGGLGLQLVEHLKDDYECILTRSSAVTDVKDAVTCDVTVEKDVQVVIDAFEPDIVIYLSVKNTDGLLHNRTDAGIKQQTDVNLFGFLNVIRYVTPLFKERNYGRLIYISSILSETPVRGAGIYSASKAFCDNIIRTYSLENSRYGITANSIQLGYFDGGLCDKVPTDLLESVIKAIPLRRLGTSKEFGNVVKSIIETEYINGSHISLTGGL